MALTFSGDKKRHFAVVALIICLLVDLRLVHQVFSDRANLLAEADATLNQLLKNAMLRTDSKLDIHDRMLSGISEVIRFNGGISKMPNLSAHRLLLRRHSITRDLQWLLLTDAEGKLSDYSLTFPAPAVDLSDREYFAVHREHPDLTFYIGKAQASRIDQLGFIPISRAVRNDMESLLGVAAAGIDPVALHTAIFEPPPPAHFQIKLLVDDGFAIACFPANADCLSREEEKHLSNHLETAGEAPSKSAKGEIVMHTLQVGERWINEAHSTKYPIRAEGHYDKAAVLAPWRSRALEIFATATLANLAFILLGLFAYRQFARRQQAIEEIQRNNEMLETRVHERTEALKRSESRAHQILLSSPVAMLLVNAQGQIEMANERAGELLGAGHSLLGQSIDALFAGAVAAIPAQLSGQNGTPDLGGPIRPREITARRLDGESIPVEIGLGAQIIDEQHYVIATIIDISARKAAEAQRLALYNRLELAIEAANIGIWSWHFADNRLAWDHRLYAFYEVPEAIRAAGLFYDFWRTRVHPDDIAATEAKLVQAKQDGTATSDEFRIVLDDGRIRHIQCGYITEKDSAGQTVGMIGVNRDITAQRQLEASLRIAQQEADAANQAKSDFLATMSHEIRTPMNAIIGMTGLVLASPLDPTQRDHLEKTHRASQALLRILNDILDYSKIEAGQMVIEQIPFALRASISSIADLFALQREEKGLGWRLEIDPVLPPFVKGDAFRLGQILANLLSNAIKFTERGEIRLRVHLAEQCGQQLGITFSVCDTGIGMTPTQTERLFSAFTQADTTISRRYGGTGLGLSIVKRLVELLGGHITVDSQAGQGTCFTFSVKFLTAENGENLPSTAELARQHADCDNVTGMMPVLESAAGLPPTFQRPVDHDQLDPLLELLASQLANNKLAAKTLITQIELLLDDSHLAAAFKRVSGPTRKLKFREAETALAGFLTSLTESRNRLDS